MDDTQRLAIVRDLLRAEHDIVALAEAHGLSPWDLAQWAGEAENEQCLVRLSMLADLQTQALLSRYRLFAAMNLIRQATREEEGGDADRKACLELLKLDLKRLPPAAGAAGAGGPIDDPALRELFYEEIQRLEEQVKQARAAMASGSEGYPRGVPGTFGNVRELPGDVPGL